MNKHEIIYWIPNSGPPHPAPPPPFIGFSGENESHSGGECIFQVYFSGTKRNVCILQKHKKYPILGS